MIELSRHIESLLLAHDCVIVPGLGGFVAHYVPARRIAEEQLFLPPSRSVGFNQQLTINDGLLVQSYMQAYDTNYPETLKIIDDGVNRLKQQIEEEGQFELPGIGILSMGMGGKYSFTPCEAGVLSPELYGLDALSLPLLQPTEGAESTLATKLPRSRRRIMLKRTEKDYTVSVSREIINYVAAAVVAVFFYFLWATPVSHVDGNVTHTASNIYSQLFAASPSAGETGSVATPAESSAIDEPRAASDAKEEQPAADVAAHLAEPSASARPSREAAPSSRPIPAAAEGGFTIVLASAITQANAEAFAARLQQEGHTEAACYKRGRMVRVICGSYPTEAEAQAALRPLRHHEAFADAWVMKK